MLAGIDVEREEPAGDVRKRITDAEGEIYDIKELFDAYARFGGMPMLADNIGNNTSATAIGNALVYLL